MTTLPQKRYASERQGARQDAFEALSGTLCEPGSERNSGDDRRSRIEMASKAASDAAFRQGVSRL